MEFHKHKRYKIYPYGPIQVVRLYTSSFVDNLSTLYVWESRINPVNNLGVSRDIYE